MTKRVGLYDLTRAQVARIEAELGVPVDQWQGAGKADLYGLILAVSEGRQLADYDDLTLRELMERVALTWDVPESE
jgi:hypothetical protein